MSFSMQDIRRFCRKRDGSVAVIFALSAVGIIGVTGLAVDFSRGSKAKSSLHAAADAAALAGARTVGTAAQREAAAKSVFESNMKGVDGIEGVTMTPKNIVQDGANYGYNVAASGTVPTTLGKILGVQDVPVSAFSEAIGGIRTPTEVVMVLDTTYSMMGWKITTLKDAATKMVDELNSLASGPGTIRYGIVPFSQYVNIGKHNRNKAWMNVPADWKETGTHCYMDYPVTGQTNCRNEWVPAQPAGTCYNDGVPYSCGGHAGYNQNVCDNTYGPPKEVCYNWSVDHKWNGCAGSRNYPLNTRDENYVNRIPGIMDAECGSEILELTPSTTQAKNKINSLTPQGETYIPSGLIWGWRMLTPQDPLNAKQKKKGDDVRKFMIIMTDGLNTKSPTYPNNDGSDGALSNKLTAETCANIAADKDNAITVYSVAFDVNDATTKGILQKCAADSNGQFFDAKNATDFMAAFKEIGVKISELRLSK